MNGSGDDREVETIAPVFSALGSQEVHEFVRYFLASLFALAIDVSVLALLTSLLGVPYLVSGAIAFLCGVLTVYMLSIIWVFEHRAMRNAYLEFGAFLVIGLIGLGLNELVLWFFTGVAGLFYLVSKVISVCIVFSWNFTARKYMLFR